jgi:hypothetical protein
MKLLVRFVFCGLLIIASTTVNAQSSLWTANSNPSQEFSGKNTYIRPSANYKLMDLDLNKLHQLQASIPFINNNQHIQGVSFDIPMPDGTIRTTNIVETLIWETKASADRVGVKTYSLVNPITKKFEGNLSVIDNGISGIFFSEKGNVLIQPVTLANAQTTNLVYYITDAEMPPLDCPVNVEAASPVSIGSTTAGDCKARVYRLAVAATGEFVSWSGGTVSQAQGYITAVVNIVNAIYKRDLNVTFNLVENSAIIYTNSSTDPYPAEVTSNTLNVNQTTLDTTASLGSGGYDVGLVFSGVSAGGLAQLNSVCTNSKARGAIGKGSNSPTPINNWFNTAVAHELGHMFGATHTFSSSISPCGTNISYSSSWEPGNGTTVMSYAVGCPAATRIQDSTDYYFHAGNIAQMQNYIASGATCVTANTTANSAPSASVGAASYNIPANTPFMLTINATDANAGNALTYTWEQMDPSNSSLSQTGPPPASNTAGPLFRSVPPSSSPIRYIPALYYLNNYTNYPYEPMPSAARTINFRGTVRDNSLLGGCTAEVNVALSVSASAGFKVTTPAWGTTWTKLGNNTALVEWTVAGTNAAPISSTQVDILLSTDGGYTFPTTLAAGVPNTGSYNVAIPGGYNTFNAKLLIKGTNNVFFNISDIFFLADALPVTLLSFKAKKEGTASIVEWSTATETNSDKFVVERSTDGINFKDQVGSVKAVGNSSQVQYYNLKDIAPLSKWNYYRLKQLDLDGKAHYSNIASVYFNKDNKSFVSIYPNPVKDNVTVSYYTQSGGNVTIEIHDSKGALVRKLNRISTADINTATLDLQSIATGIYTLKCYSGSELIGITKLVKN